jgi:hypothetical protein
VCLTASCYADFHVSFCLGRYIVQSLPLMLLSGIAIVLLFTKLVQAVQLHVLHVLPFGSLSNLSLPDITMGIFVSGVFMLYLGKTLQEHDRVLARNEVQMPELFHCQLSPPVDGQLLWFPHHCSSVPLLSISCQSL